MICSPLVRLAGCGLLAFACALPLASQQGQSQISTSGLRASASIPPTATHITPELRGDIYMARKMYREAIDMYREAPSSAIIENKVGIAYHQLLALDLAKKSYERAVKLDPRYSEAINNLGTIYYSQRSYRRSISYYKRALRYSPPSASIDANLGAAYFARKDFKNATLYYEQALKLDPGVFEHHGNFGTIMQERSVSDRAVFHLYLAKMYAKEGANDRAIIYLRKALEEGIKGRDKIVDMPEFSQLKSSADFKQLIAENPKPL